MCDDHFCWVWKSNCTFDGPSFFNGLPGWLQFFGVIGGLILTINLYKDQIKQTKLARIESAIERRRVQALIVNHFSDLANTLIIESIVCYEQTINVIPTNQNMKGLRAKIDEAITWSRSFNIDTFSNEEMVSFINIRSSLQTISTWIDKSYHEIIASNPDYLKDVYAEIASDLLVLSNAK